MKMKRLIICSMASVVTMGATTISAAIDPSAAVVMVRQSCTDNGAPLDNCFTSMASLNNWISNTRQPNANNPLRVDIGPGTFSEQVTIQCNPASGYTGYTTYDGSGSGQTIFEGVSYNPPIAVDSCTELTFSDFKITTDFYGGVVWSGGGNSKWANIDIDASARAWYEPACGAEPGNHYWFGSKLNANAVFTIATTYQASCDETWFFGSEVKSTVPAGQSANLSAAVQAFDDGVIHLYGSNLRSFNHGNGVVPAASVGIGSQGTNDSGGEIHIHGTGIDVISTTGNDIVALQTNNESLIHADVSAYVMKSTGNITRISNNGGTVRAPYQWNQNNQPPQINSENGADMFIETNCDSAACHDEDTGTETHLMVYNDSCNFAGHGPWFDVVTGRCRGDMN